MALPTSLAGIALNEGGNAIAFAAGFTLARVLEPAGTALQYEAWAEVPIRVPDAGLLAAGVSQGQIDLGRAQEWAKMHGFDADTFAAMVDIANVGPALGLAYDAWRRGQLTEDEFDTAMRRQGIEPEWFEALRSLKDRKLDPVQLANAIHRGLIPDPGLLAVSPPTGQGKVPAYPTYKIDPLSEAASFGIDRDRLGTLVGLTGLPMGSHEAANAVFRNVIEKVDFERAIAEGNTRNEWGEAIFEQSRQIPTARDFLENALRGYITLPEALDGAALHGMTEEYATMLYQNQGRPMVLRQITTGLARGGKFEPEPGEITDPYRAAIVEGNLKPAYYDLAYANRYTLPSPFVIRSMAAAGDLTEEETKQLLLESGWEPGLAAKVAPLWAGGGGTAVDPHVKKAQTSLYTAAHNTYVKDEGDDATARAALTALQVPEAAQTQVLTLWSHERDIARSLLTPAQVKKAYGGGLYDRETALQILDRRGYSAADAATLLDE